MKYMKLLMPLTLMLSMALLMSCASATPASPISYTAQLEEESARQKAADCALFKPEPIPETAPLEWRQHAEAFGVKWRHHCEGVNQ